VGRQRWRRIATERLLSCEAVLSFQIEGPLTLILFESAETPGPTGRHSRSLELRGGNECRVAAPRPSFISFA